MRQNKYLTAQSKCATRLARIALTSTAVLLLFVVPGFSAETINVTIINRQYSATQYTYVAPGYSVANSNTTVNCSGGAGSASCSGSTHTTASEVQPRTTSYAVQGSTLSLQLPDGRIAIVNCAGKYSLKFDYINARSCRLPLVNDIQVEFSKNNAKLRWPVSIDGKKTESETYQILAVLPAPMATLVYPAAKEQDTSLRFDAAFNAEAVQEARSKVVGQLPLDWQAVCSAEAKNCEPPVVHVWIAGDTLYETSENEGTTIVARTSCTAKHTGEEWTGSCEYKWTWKQSPETVCKVETSERITEISLLRIAGVSQKVDLTPLNATPGHCPIAGSGNIDFEYIPAKIQTRIDTGSPQDQVGGESQYVPEDAASYCRTHPIGIYGAPGTASGVNCGPAPVFRATAVAEKRIAVVSPPEQPTGRVRDRQPPVDAMTWFDEPTPGPSTEIRDVIITVRGYDGVLNILRKLRDSDTAVKSGASVLEVGYHPASFLLNANLSKNQSVTVFRWDDETLDDTTLVMHIKVTRRVYDNVNNAVGHLRASIFTKQ
jgi:hypothetical protein